MNSTLDNYVKIQTLPIFHFEGATIFIVKFFSHLKIFANGLNIPLELEKKIDH